MIIKHLTPTDLYSVLSRPSAEALADMKAFGSERQGLMERALDAYPFAWAIIPVDVAECVCWYNVSDNKAYTSMFYSSEFLKHKGITSTVKSIIDDNAVIAKGGGIEVIEVHSTLSHPLSESWYEKLGFTKTDTTYPLGNTTITVFERRL